MLVACATFPAFCGEAGIGRALKIDAAAVDWIEAAAAAAAAEVGLATAAATAAGKVAAAAAAAGDFASGLAAVVEEALAGSCMTKSACSISSASTIAMRTEAIRLLWALARDLRAFAVTGPPLSLNSATLASTSDAETLLLLSAWVVLVECIPASWSMVGSLTVLQLAQNHRYTGMVMDSTIIPSYQQSKKVPE